MTLRLGFLLSVASLLGCGEATTPALVCEPACPAGLHCSETGCVPDGQPGDMATGAAQDAASACATACAGATPHCRNGACVPCIADDHCPLGQVCKQSAGGTVCAPGCADDARCGPPGGSMKCCDGACIDTSKDPVHCGACATRCESQHAGARCVNGACMSGTCAAGYGDCDSDASNGCETNLRVDTQNCTACGMKCAIANAVVGCAGGCYIAACQYGWDDCDDDGKNGCEVNVTSDIRNCGACGALCPAVPHAKNACLNASCQLTACDAGFADCDAVPQNGCEVNTGTDAANCGMCGKKCAQGLVCSQGLCTCPNCNLPNAKSSCVNLQCAVAQCNTNYGDCDGQPQNGCERSLQSDVMNCGQCGKACAQGLVCTNGACTCPNCNFANARTACVNNQCVLDTCLPGYGNCDGNDANGCEVTIDSDANNCGGCGVVCPQNLPTCLAGKCDVQTCMNNPKWQPVNCSTGEWVWSRDRAQAKDVMTANAKRVLASYMYGDKGNQALCSLDGKGWISTQTFVMKGCDLSWYHIGGRYTGDCGGHDGEIWRHLVLGPNDCYPY